jgi:ABC-type multidrug transport system fused ATPase/permease subunit
VLGLALTLLLQLAGTNFPWMIRQSAEIVNQMVSVERVAAFGHLPSEGETVTSRDNSDALRGWPKVPSLTVDNLTVRYRPELEPALRRVSFSVESGMRVGVVGRYASIEWILARKLSPLQQHSVTHFLNVG